MQDALHLSLTVYSNDTLPEVRKSRQQNADLWKVEHGIKQFFNLGFAATVKT